MRHLKLYLSLCLLMLSCAAFGSSELKATDTASKTVYAVILNPAGQAWNGTTFAAYADANWSAYAVLLTEKGTSVFYVGDFPAAIVTAGRYTVAYFERAGGAGALSDTLVGQTTLDWDGAAVVTNVSLSATVTATNSRVTTALPNAAPTAAGGLITVGTGAGQLLPNGTTGNLPVGVGITTATSGTAQASTNTTITLAAGTGTTFGTTDQLKGDYIFVSGGTGVGQARTITGWTFTTNVATVSRAWAVNPDNTSTYYVIGNPHPALDANLAVTVGMNSDKAGYSLTTAPPTAVQVRQEIDANSTQLAAQATSLFAIKLQTDKFVFDGSNNVLSQVKTYFTNLDPATMILAATASSWNTAGTIGQKLNAAGSAGNPWTTDISTGYTGTQAGLLVYNMTQAYAQRNTAPTWYTAPANVSDYARNNVAPSWWTAPFTDYAKAATAPTWWTAPPTDYQQRGQAVVLPTTPPTGYANPGYFYAPVLDNGGGSSTTSLTLTVTRDTQNEPVLTWTADPSATSYKVLRSVNGINYTVLFTTGLLTYTDTARPNGTVYYSVIGVH